MCVDDAVGRLKTGTRRPRIHPPGISLCHRMATPIKQAPDFSRADVLAIVLPTVVTLFAVPLWAVQSWQRPHLLAGVPEEWWLAAAGAGAGAM